MKIIKEMLIIIILSTCILNIVPSYVLGKDGVLYMNDIMSDFKAKEAEDRGASTMHLKLLIGKFLSVLRILTGLITLITISTTGFNYVVASTPDLKAEIKNKMLPIIIGMVLVFGAVTIATFIIRAFE